LDLSRDLGAIEDAILSVTNCRLVIIDPITAYTGDRDSHNNTEIRGLLAPLAKLAEEHGVAMVAVSHLNKGKGGAAIYRTMGSLAFVAAARAAWIIAKDTQDPSRRLMVSAKNNLGDDSSGLAYRIDPVDEAGAPAVAWEPDPLQLTADDLLGDSSSNSGGGPRDEAEEWLRDMLSDGLRPAAELKEQAKADGIAQRTLDRVKKSLGVISKREGHENGGRWMWHHPQQSRSDHGAS
ncbi:MAG: AAA family ATPase, partial [Planctomycetota bacterium]